MPFNDDGKKRTGAIPKSDGIELPVPQRTYMDLTVAGRGCEWLGSSSVATIGGTLDAVCTLTHVAEEIFLNVRRLLLMNCPFGLHARGNFAKAAPPPVASRCDAPDQK